MAKKEEGIFFVNVSGTDELRKELLESSRSIIEILKDYEKVKSANTEKVKEIENLRLKMKEVSRLVLRLKSGLPAIKLKEAREKDVKEEVIKKPASGLEKLEQELDEIEAKLRSIS